MPHITSAAPVFELAVLERAMARALELAENGPAENDNPQVGCVILDKTGEIVAEGWHMGSGTPHAEVMAMDALPAEHRARAAELTAVVTLEPCNHTGKTGPCAVALTEAGIGSVVYALNDPGETAGSGSAGSGSAGGAVRLRHTGVQLRSGVLAADAKALLAGWLARYAASHPINTPRVIVKWAQSLDGRAAAADGTSQWITGAEARLDVHQRRAAADAILVGTGTAIADNPSLTARDSEGNLLAAQPRPIVLGTRELPSGSTLAAHPELIRLSGANLAAEFASLAQLGIRTVFVEGGPTVISAIIAAGLADEFLIYTAPVLLGGDNLAVNEIGVATLANAQELDITEFIKLGEDTLVVARKRA